MKDIPLILIFSKFVESAESNMGSEPLEEEMWLLLLLLHGISKFFLALINLTMTLLPKWCQISIIVKSSKLGSKSPIQSVLGGSLDVSIVELGGNGILIFVVVGEGVEVEEYVEWDDDIMFLWMLIIFRKIDNNKKVKKKNIKIKWNENEK